MSWEEDLKKMATMSAALNSQCQRVVVLVESLPPEMLKDVKMPDFGSAAGGLKKQAMGLMELGNLIETALAEKINQHSSSNDQHRSASPPAV